ncbi:MAG: hypothetical protein E7415_02615 [Ruminococcaceae bacterium]|nr:hypothetical protein [Oscillospiraceae bacterium]
MKKRYRAYVINGRKMIKNAVSVVIGIAVACGMIRFADLGGVTLKTKSEVSQTVGKKKEISGQKNRKLNEIVVDEFLFLKCKGKEKTQSVFNEVNADRMKTLPQTGMIVGYEGELPIREIDSGQNKAVGNKNILIKNETQYGVNTKELLEQKIGLDMSKSGPKILIIHTHGSESYTEEGREFYIEGTGDRNTDTSFNVVHVGDKMAEVFEKAGIEVIHDRKMHDQPSYNGSYASSLESAEKYVEEYPSIQIVLDIHRDAIVYGDGTKAKTVTEIDGKKTAQLMFVVGTNEGGLVHDNWRENLKFAVKLQNEINKKYPNLMRGINLRRERFNGHVTKGSLIIEVGTSGNTLNEAVRGGTLCAEIIAGFLSGV